MTQLFAPLVDNVMSWTNVHVIWDILEMIVLFQSVKILIRMIQQFALDMVLVLIVKHALASLAGLVLIVHFLNVLIYLQMTRMFALIMDYAFLKTNVCVNIIGLIHLVKDVPMGILAWIVNQ